jgi:hypothetical protein
MTTQELIEQFEEGSLPSDSFHHADHVRLAFAYLQHYPLLEALEKFPAALRRFAKHHGKPNLYHQTITGHTYSSSTNASPAPITPKSGKNSPQQILIC